MSLMFFITPVNNQRGRVEWKQAISVQFPCVLRSFRYVRVALRHATNKKVTVVKCLITALMTFHYLIQDDKKGFRILTWELVRNKGLATRQKEAFRRRKTGHFCGKRVFLRQTLAFCGILVAQFSSFSSFYLLLSPRSNTPSYAH